MTIKEYHRKEARIIAEAVRIIAEEAQAPDKRNDYPEADTNKVLTDLVQIATKHWRDAQN